jgi:ABC-type uncharacterized transport system involved in gliding motility auxiliary subunit
MNPALLILPFLALLVAALATAVGSALPEARWVAHVGWGLGAGIVGLWVALDFDNFKALFTRKGAKYGASSGLVVVLGVLVIVGVATLAARPRFNKSLDLTRDRLNTLSDQSLKVIESLDALKEPLKVTAYMTDEAVEKEFRDLLALYETRGAAFNIEWVDPQSNPTRAMADKITEGNTVIFRRGDQEKRLTTFNEEKLTNAVVNVLKDQTKKIYFTKGHGEGEIKSAEAEGFSIMVTALEGDKYAVEELALLDAAKVPEDAALVVVAGPRYDFSEEEARILEAYLKHGGSVLAMARAATKVDTLNKTLEQFGVRFGDDLLKLDEEKAGVRLSGGVGVVVADFDQFHPVTRDFGKQAGVSTIMMSTRSVEEVKDNANKLKVTLAAKTIEQTNRIRGVTQPSDLQTLTEDRVDDGAFPVVAAASGKAQAPATANNEKSDKGDGERTDTGATDGAAQGDETRLVVIGSVDFANNSGAAQLAQNRDLFLNVTSWLMQDEGFIAIRPKDPTKSTLEMTSVSAGLTLLVISFIYPLVFLGGGTVAWLRRRRA